MRWDYFTVVLLLFGIGVVDSCYVGVKGCRCTHGTLDHITCRTSAGMTKMPRLSPTIRYLIQHMDLRFNNLRYVVAWDMAGYSSLQQLDLSHQKAGCVDTVQIPTRITVLGACSRVSRPSVL